MLIRVIVGTPGAFIDHLEKGKREKDQIQVPYSRGINSPFPPTKHSKYLYKEFPSIRTIMNKPPLTEF